MSENVTIFYFSFKNDNRMQRFISDSGSRKCKTKIKEKLNILVKIRRFRF